MNMPFFTKAKSESSSKKKNTAVKLSWQKDTELQSQMEEIIDSIEFSHVVKGRVFCYRTKGSKAKAYARIWSFPKIFQEVLSQEAAYVIEIISEKFDKLSEENKKKVIIHELLHIPKNFSGSLLPHKYGHTFIEKEVESLFKMYKNKKI